MTLEPLTPERRRAMTRRHLLDAAAIVFTRDGFHGATLDDIAATAGFSKGAVYSNFKSKDDLFLALLDDRVERQFAVTTEVLDAGSHEAAEQMPRMRDLLRSSPFAFDDAWATLYLEFVLYARRNPVAAARLAESSRRIREFEVELVIREYANAGGLPRYPAEHLAAITSAMFEGLGIAHLIDPSSVEDGVLDTLLQFLYDSMAVDEPPADAAAAADGEELSRS